MDEESFDDDDEDVQVTIACSGPPYCELRGDKALRAQQGGCIYCTFIYVEADGRKVIIKPGLA